MNNIERLVFEFMKKRAITYKQNITEEDARDILEGSLYLSQEHMKRFGEVLFKDELDTPEMVLEVMKRIAIGRKRIDKEKAEEILSSSVILVETYLKWRKDNGSKTFN